VAEIDLLVVLVIFEHREIDDPAEFEALVVDQAQLLGDARAREAGELGGLRFLAGREEQAVVGTEAEFAVGERSSSSP
jgi:hypothetical protein